MSKVSVIIVSYNEKEYLDRAVNSCLRQNWDDMEIIIGDDGSSDGSVEYIESKFTGEGFKHFVMTRDERPDRIIPGIRVSNVIKRALQEASGSYIVLLSGDDYFVHDDMLKDAVGFLDENPEYNAYVSGYRKATDDKILAECIPAQLSPTLYWSGGYLHLSCFVFRRFDSEELLARFCDDTGLQFVLALKGKWKYTRTISFVYYQRAESIMHRADALELSLLEILLLQDVLNWPGEKSCAVRLATCSRFCKPLRYAVAHRKQLTDHKYEKYLLSAEKYDNNIVGELLDYDRSFSIRFRLFFKLLFMRLCVQVFRALRKRNGAAR